VLALIGVAFAFVTATVALALVVSTWLACLIVTAVLFATAGVLGLVAFVGIRKGSPPVPKQAIEQAKLTGEAIKG
jgi:hypothetical protein